MIKRRTRRKRFYRVLKRAPNGKWYWFASAFSRDEAVRLTYGYSFKEMAFISDTVRT